VCPAQPQRIKALAQQADTAQDRFATSFVHHLSMQGAAWFAVILFLTKVCHEFGHGITAKRHGAKVPKMGVALVVLFPMLYTDTNDVWRLGNRRRRLQVSIAGVATELLIACWATLLWGLLPEGRLSDACLLLATTTWVTTVLLNLSPFMRFDGYFVLSDWSGITNLHEEAGALGRWKLRQLLFGIDDPMPPVTAPSKASWLIVFAWFTWIYRLSVFLGIAVLVYHFAVKILGIAMFVVELGYFIAYPIFKEIREWASRSDRIKVSPRARFLAWLLLGALACACLPWPTRVRVSAYLRTAEDVYLYAPEDALVERLLVKDGQLVKTGQPLAALESAKLTHRLREGEARVRRFDAEIAAARVSTGLSDRLPVLMAQRDTSQSQLAAAQDDAVRLRPSAPCDGVVRWFDPELAEGAWVAREEPLLVLRRPGPPEAFAYVDDEAVQRISVGDTALFFMPTFSARAIPLEVVGIDRDVAQVLASPTLAEAAGGTVPSRLDGRGNALPTRSMYRISLRSTDASLPLDGHDWRGHLVVRGAGQAPIVGLYRAALALLWREAGF
jgi:putative peptide zinc metalloprotease protein